VIEAGFMF